MSEKARHPAPLSSRAAAALARLVLRAGARVTIEIDGELPKDGPLIVIANHISAADPPLVAGWLTKLLGRRLHILAKETLFVGPVGWFLRSQGVTPVRRGGNDIEAYRSAKQVLDRGDVLCIFPEGTRSFDGVMGEPKPGVAMLATREQVPILPVGISGSDWFLGRGKALPRLRAPIRLHIGKPFSLELDAGLSRRAAITKASDELMARIAELVDDRHRGRFGPVPQSNTSHESGEIPPSDDETQTG